MIGQFATSPSTRSATQRVSSVRKPFYLTERFVKICYSQDPMRASTEIWNALRAANAEEFVSRLPAGLDANVGERGIRLSVGEKQRISIARAILKDPPMLVLG